MESLFSQATEEIPKLYNSVGNFKMCIGLFQKEASLKISRSFLLMGFTGGVLQNHRPVKHHPPPTLDHRTTGSFSVDPQTTVPPTGLQRTHQSYQNRPNDYRLNKTHKVFCNSFHPYTCNHFTLVINYPEIVSHLNLSFGILYCIF